MITGRSEPCNSASNQGRTLRLTIRASIIICAHNPRLDYLGRVLDGLRAQTLPLGEWELLLVDNASDEPLANRFDLSWHPQARHVNEAELGLAFARARGIREATGELLVFVDDDNVLTPDYLAEALRIARNWPRLGAWGGLIVLDCEIPPPARLKSFLSMLALREVDSPRWGNIPHCHDIVPWGAGMCIRAGVGAAYCKHLDSTRLHVTDRRGRALTGFGDVEICYVAADIGYGTGVFPDLVLTHLIPKERLALRYLMRLARANILSEMIVAFKWRGDIPPSPFSPQGVLALTRRIVGAILRVSAVLSVRKIIRETDCPGNPTRSPTRVTNR